MVDIYTKLYGTTTDQFKIGIKHQRAKGIYGN